MCSVGSGVVIPLLVAWLLANAAAAFADDLGPQVEELKTQDGISFVCDFYRPDRTATGVVVFFPDRGESRAEWMPLALDLAAAGLLVAVSDLRPALAEASGLAWGRVEEPYSRWTEVWRETQAVAEKGRSLVGGMSLPLVLAGSGQAAAAAAIGASRLPEPPSALFLIAPKGDLAGIPIAPVLAGLERPTLVLCPLAESPESEVAREIFLALRRARRLWEVDALAGRATVLASRRQLWVDLAAWLAGVLATDPGAEDKGGAP